MHQVLVNLYLVFYLTTSWIIRSSANYHHSFLVLNFVLYKSMVVGLIIVTVPLSCITTTFSCPNDIFIVCLGSTNETTFTVVQIPHPLFTRFLWLVFFSSETYWDNLCADLEAYAKHAHRKRISMADFELLFRRYTTEQLFPTHIMILFFYGK